MANPNDLNATINLITDGGTETSVLTNKDDGRKLNKGRGRGKLSENIHDVNFKSIAKLGLGIRQVRMANEIVGAYTGDRLTQRKVETGITFLQYGIGITQFGALGVAYAAGDLAYRGLNYQIRRTRENTIARKIRDISGNSARSFSRSSGDKL